MFYIFNVPVFLICSVILHIVVKLFVIFICEKCYTNKLDFLFVITYTRFSVILCVCMRVLVWMLVCVWHVYAFAHMCVCGMCLCVCLNMSVCTFLDRNVIDGLHHMNDTHGGRLSLGVDSVTLVGALLLLGQGGDLRGTTRLLIQQTLLPKHTYTTCVWKIPQKSEVRSCTVFRWSESRNSLYLSTSQTLFWNFSIPSSVTITTSIYIILCRKIVCDYLAAWAVLTCTWRTVHALPMQAQTSSVITPHQRGT